MDKEEQKIQINKEKGEKGPIKYRISTMLIFGLIAGAIVNDCINWIPVIGTITDFIYWFVIFVIFYLKGMGIINPKNLATMLIDLVVEAIPAIQFLPFTTAGIILIIWVTRTEDRTGLKLDPSKLPQAKRNLAAKYAIKK